MHALQIAILIETSTALGRGMIAGIGAYAKIHGPWYFHIVTGHLVQRLPPKREWNGDGVIARIQTHELARQLRRRALPTVRVSGIHYPEWHYVGTDNITIGRNGAIHFLDRGFKRFAFFGVKNALWSDQRQKGFAEEVQKYGYPCEFYHDDELRYVGSRQEKIGRWLNSLQKPVAIMTCDDPHGRRVIEACRQHNASVPEAVAVCGIDNDEPICTMTTPSLSSVPLNAFRIGYLAAQTLHRMIQGETVQDVADIDPLPVVTRQSSDLIAIEDPIVAQAVKIIREHAYEGLTVKMLLRQVPCSRRTLEMRFQKEMRRSPHEEIRRVQINRAQALLLETDLKINEVARLSGFVGAPYLNDVFRKKYSQTPATYRRSHVTGDLNPIS